MKSAKLPQTVKTLSDGKFKAASDLELIVGDFLGLCILKTCLSHLTVEDHKELPNAINPELRQKEVQMNFFNQLTSVFNPDLTTILASPTASHMQASFPEFSPLPSAQTAFLRLYH